MPKTVLEEKLYRDMENTVSYGKTKYARYLESVKSAMPNISTSQEANIIKCLKNTEDALRMDPQYGEQAVEKFFKESTSEATRPSDINAFIHYAFDMVTAMIPANPIEEFATTQAIEKRVGEIFYMDIVESQNKGAYFTAGNDYMSSLYGPEYVSDAYSDERVLLEQAYVGDGSTTLTFNTYHLQWLPLKPTFVNVMYTVDGNAYSVFDDGNSNIVDAVNLSSGTISYTTGLLTLNFKTGHGPMGNVIVSYQQDSAREDVNQNPELILQLTSQLVTAKRRFLNTRWMLDSAIMLQKEHGKDIEKELTEKVLSGVMNEIAMEAANQIWTDATVVNSGTPFQFSQTPPSSTIPLITYRQEILGFVNNIGTTIEQTVQKVTSNFIISGVSLVKWVKGLPRDVFARVKYPDKTPVGMHVIGVLDDQHKIIQDFNYSANNFLVGCKGPDWLTTGFVYSPFIPLMTTPINWSRPGDQWRSLLTWYALKTVNPGFFARAQMTA
jgi:hypothetical protein